MATARPFAYNSGSIISGTTQMAVGEYLTLIVVPPGVEPDFPGYLSFILSIY